MTSMDIISNARFETSEETQIRMAEYNAKVIDMVAELFIRPGMPQSRMPRPRLVPAMSDEDRDNEIRAQAILYPAVKMLREAAEFALPLTELRKDALNDLLMALADNVPDQNIWSGEISGARRGY